MMKMMMNCCYAALLLSFIVAVSGKFSSVQFTSVFIVTLNSFYACENLISIICDIILLSSTCDNLSILLTFIYRAQYQRSWAAAYYGK